jgi:hypothetical protein
MNVNDFFTQVGDFWRSISIPILFHLIFLALYSYLFGHISFKTRLEQYIRSESFARTKAILTEFELWTKLPYILLITSLVYLSIFNSISEVTFSWLPLNFSYSNSDFFKEYQQPRDIIEIAKYGRVSSPHLWDVDNLLSRFLEEYKIKYPDLYKSSIDSWGQNEFVERRTLLSMSCLTMLLILVICPRRLRQQNLRDKAATLSKLLGLILLTLPLLFFLRYRAEQAIEEQFTMKILFVKSCLETDSSKRITYNEQALRPITKQLENELHEPPHNMEAIWISRIVGEHKFLEYLIGRRVLKSITIIQAQPYIGNKP